MEVVWYLKLYFWFECYQLVRIIVFQKTFSLWLKMLVTVLIVYYFYFCRVPLDFLGFQVPMERKVPGYDIQVYCSGLSNVNVLTWVPISQHQTHNLLWYTAYWNCLNCLWQGVAGKPGPRGQRGPTVSTLI